MNCLCTGDQQTSIFVLPETCKEDFHSQHKHENKDKGEFVCSENGCNKYSDHDEDCGCNSPEVFFFKLKDKILTNEFKLLAVQSFAIFILNSEVLRELYTSIDNVNLNFYTDSPPLIKSSFDLLIEIQQLKIYLLA